MGYIRYVNQIHIYDDSFDGDHGLDFKSGLRAQHLQIAFCHFLEKCCLGNNVKISILCNTKMPERHRMASVSDDGIQYWKAGEVGMLQVWPIDLRSYLTLNESQKDRFLIDIISSSLTRLANHLGVAADPITEAIDKLERITFPYEWECVGLRKSNRKRSVYVHLFYRVDRSGESWRAEIRDKNGVLVKSQSLVENADFFESTHALCCVKIENETLRAFNILGDVICDIPLEA